MKIIVFGATGNVGRRVVDEALLRGHEVTAVLRDTAKAKLLPDVVFTEAGDAANSSDVARLCRDKDVVINATRSATSDEKQVAQITRALLEGLRNSNARLLIVGGAASLTVPGSGGRLVIDDSKFLHPDARPIGQASLTQYRICAAHPWVDWTYLSPPARLVPGQRTANYRLGRDELLLDEDGDSSISIEDLAVVLLDELENPKHHRVRFTAAY